MQNIGSGIINSVTMMKVKQNGENSPLEESAFHVEKPVKDSVSFPRWGGGGGGGGVSSIGSSIYIYINIF